jgi:hypothetical protein
VCDSLMGIGFILGDENVLELNRNDDYATLWKY